MQRAYVPMPRKYYDAPEFSRSLRYSDKLWIKEQILSVSAIYRPNLSRRYSDIYIEVYRGEPFIHKKIPTARRIANEYLRDSVKHLQSMPPND